MVNLPHEIWSHIAHFVPPSNLERLISVNSTFYDIAMDCRYRQLSFAYLDDRMLRNIVRLKDPVVAKRVRVLHVYPVFLKQVLDPREPDSPLVRRSLLLKLMAFATQILEQKRGSVRRKFKTPQDMIHAILDVFGGLPNVTDYHIVWCGLQDVPKSPVPLLAAVFQSNLRKLALDISLENVVSLLASHPTTRNIEELDLVIRIDHFVERSNHLLIMIDHLAPAVARLKLSLRKLTIQAWEPLDLSPFFRTLQWLPLLEHLTLGIPIQEPHLGDPQGLTAFLNRQSATLRSLTLRATHYSGPGFTPDTMSIDGWVMGVLTDVHIAHLRSLDISSSLFPFTASLACVLRFSTTITSLVLTGCYHTFADIVAVLDAFRDRHRAERLETLRLGSVALTPGLLDLLAHELPNLYRLELIVREVTTHADEYLQSYTSVRHRSESQIDYFFCEMEKRRYPQWQLRRIKILLTSFPYCIPYGPHVEQLLAVCVPTIRGFS